MSHMTYLFLAYAVIWTALFLYVLRLGRRLNHLHRQVDALQNEFDRKEKKAHPDNAAMSDRP